ARQVAEWPFLALESLLLVEPVEVGQIGRRLDAADQTGTDLAAVQPLHGLKDRRQPPFVAEGDRPAVPFADVLSQPIEERDRHLSTGGLVGAGTWVRRGQQEAQRQARRTTRSERLPCRREGQFLHPAD